MNPLILVGLVAGGVLLYVMSSESNGNGQTFPIATYEDEYGNIILDMYGAEYENGNVQIIIRREGETAYLVFNKLTGEQVREGGDPQLLSEMHGYLQLLEIESEYVV